MFKTLKDKFTGVALWFYGITTGLLKSFNFAPLSSSIARRFSKPTPLVFVELFVAISLTVNFFFLVKPMCLPKRDGNAYSSMLFIYLSDALEPHRQQAEDQVPMNFRTRLLAPLTSGKFLDTVYHQPLDPRSDGFQNVFGSYHSLWLLLLFLALILLRKDALLVMLGVFAGLMYNFIEPAGMYYYPWDMPAMFFFTLACLLYDRRQYGLLMATVFIGGLFKETTMCCALFILLDGQWSMAKRIGGFFATVIATLAVNKMLVFHYGVHAGMFTMGNAKSLSGLFMTEQLFRNVSMVFSTDPNHVLFANAGSLIIAMLLPWRNRRDVIIKIVMLVFIVGQAFYGVANEFRIWYEMLPLGWMLLSERISDWRQKMVEVPAMSKTTPAKKPGVQKTSDTDSLLASRVLQGSYWLMISLIFIAMLGIFVLAKINPPPAGSSAQDNLATWTKKAQAGDPDAAYRLGMVYEQNQDFNDAAIWLQKAAQQGNLSAADALGLLQANQQDYTDAAQTFHQAAARGDINGELNLAILLLNGKGMKPDAATAAALLQKAAPQGAAQAQFILGILYEQGQGVSQDYIQAYKWLKLAQLQGFANADKELSTCSVAMSPAQIASAEKLVSDFQAAKQ